MQAKYLYVLTHIIIKNEIGTVNHAQALQFLFHYPFQCSASIVGPFFAIYVSCLSLLF